MNWVVCLSMIFWVEWYIYEACAAKIWLEHEILEYFINWWLICLHILLNFIFSSLLGIFCWGIIIIKFLLDCVVDAARWWGCRSHKCWLSFHKSRRLHWGRHTRIRSSCPLICVPRRPGLSGEGLPSTRYRFYYSFFFSCIVLKLCCWCYFMVFVLFTTYGFGLLLVTNECTWVIKSFQYLVFSSLYMGGFFYFNCRWGFLYDTNTCWNPANLSHFCPTLLITCIHYCFLTCLCTSKVVPKHCFCFLCPGFTEDRAGEEEGDVLSHEEVRY